MFLLLPTTDSPNKMQSKNNKRYQEGMFVRCMSMLWADEKMRDVHGFLHNIFGLFKETKQRQCADKRE